jgi:hypothetical protein
LPPERAGIPGTRRAAGVEDRDLTVRCIDVPLNHRPAGVDQRRGVEVGVLLGVEPVRGHQHAACVIVAKHQRIHISHVPDVLVAHVRRGRATLVLLEED